MIKKEIRLNVNGRRDKRATDKFRLIKNTWKETAKIIREQTTQDKEDEAKTKRQKENINELINAISENKYEQSETAAKSSTE